MWMKSSSAYLRLIQPPFAPPLTSQSIDASSWMPQSNSLLRRQDSLCFQSSNRMQDNENTGLNIPNERAVEELEEANGSNVSRQSPPNYFPHSIPANQISNTASSRSSVNVIQHHHQQQQSSSGKKIISPFAPEATVPLPFQLDELGRVTKSFSSLGTTVWKRNERERYRVRCVNEGYEKLRSHLPIDAADRRLSKVDTLRLAIYYIRHLDHLLCDNNHDMHCECFKMFGTEDM